MRDIREDLQERIEAAGADILQLQSRLRQLRSLHSMLKRWLRLESGGEAKERIQSRSGLTPGSTPYEARRVLREAGCPLHIKEIAQRANKKESLVITALSKYHSEGRVFKRTAPSTFGLIEEAGDDSNDETP